MVYFYFTVFCFSLYGLGFVTAYTWLMYRAEVSWNKLKEELQKTKVNALRPRDGND